MDFGSLATLILHFSYSSDNNELMTMILAITNVFVRNIVLYSFLILFAVDVHFNFYMSTYFITSSARMLNQMIDKFVNSVTMLQRTRCVFPRYVTFFSLLFILGIFFRLWAKAVVVSKWIGCNFDFRNPWICFLVMKYLYKSHT